MACTLTARQIGEHLEDYISGSITLSAFYCWFLPAARTAIVERNAPGELVALASDIVVLIADHLQGDITEGSLMANLAIRSALAILAENP